MLLFCLFGYVSVVYSFPSGAGESSCSDLHPRHGEGNTKIPFSDKPSLYAITRSNLVDGRINVTLSGSYIMHGFLLQAQFPNGSYVDCGSFTLPNLTKYCCNQSPSSVTHSTELHNLSLSFEWTPPASYKGDVKFVATVVKEKDEFWKLSDPIESIPKLKAINFATCGSSKSCFAPSCLSTSGTCENGVTWANSIDERYVIFEIQKYLEPEDQYVALGLSKDASMGDDSVVSCMKNSNGTISTYLSWNEGHSNSRIADQSALVADQSSGVIVGDIMTCRFSLYKEKPSSKRDAASVFYPDRDYYLFLASGPISGNSISEHSKEPLISSNSLDLSNFRINYNLKTKKDISLKKAHGIIMVLGWLIFASSGILMPRYFKPTWNEPATCVKKPVWFIIHFVFMMLVFCMQIAAFVIIFVYAKHYVSDLEWPADAHPVLGIITMILVLANPIMAIFRCQPQDSKRWIFNILHFLVGQGAYFTANICIYLSMRISEINMPPWCMWVLVAHTCFQILTEIILSAYCKYLESQVYSKRASGNNEYTVSTIASDPKKKKVPTATLR